MNVVFDYRLFLLKSCRGILWWQIFRLLPFYGGGMVAFCVVGAFHVVAMVSAYVRNDSTKD